MMTVGVSYVAISFRLTYYFLQNEWSIHALRFFSEHFNQYKNLFYYYYYYYYFHFASFKLNIYTHNSER